MSRAVSLRLLACIFLTQFCPFLFGQAAVRTFLQTTTPAASAVDAAGNVYITGSTTEDTVPVTPGAFQRQFVAGPCADGFKCAHSFVMKISADGASVIYATYLGGSRSDIAQAIAVDSSGSAYVAGTTSSLDFPVTAAGNQLTPGPGFIARISPDGSMLLASTYLSGEPWNVALDSAGNVFASGAARTDAFTTTAGAFQTSPQGGADAFVMKMNSTLGTMIYSTRIGGSTNEFAYALTVDSQGSAYVGGFTDSKNFPVSSGAYVGSGGTGAFVAKLSQDGSRLIFASILGAGFTHGIAVDSSQAVYVGGGADNGFASTEGAFRTSGEGFAAKLSPDGTRLIYATRLPAYSAHSIFPRYGVTLVDGDHLLVWDSNFQQVPTTPNASHPCTTKGTMETYFIELNAAGTDRVYGTYMPGLITVTPAGAWSLSQDPNKLLDRTPVHGFGTQGMTCVSSAATFFSGPIAPGEFVSIFGIDIGPDQPASLQLDDAGKVATSLGGVRVFFNGVAAPLSYVSKNQINAVVPFELASWPNSYVTILRDGVVLPELTIPVTPTSLGFFRIGDGYAVVNQNGTLNSQFAAAPTGSIVTIYATGAGLMEPAVASGSLGNAKTSIARPPKALFRVVSGFHLTDTPLSLVYAGDAPTLVQGVVVLQVQIPDQTAIGSTSLAFLEENETAAIPIWVK